MTAALLCLACLFVLATQAYSSVRRRTSRRGKPRPRVVVDQDQLKVQMSRIASEIQREARTMRPVERGSYSASAPAVPSRRTTTRAFTAPGTMPATSGSSRPISAGADNLALIQVPMSEEPCRDRAPSSERARTCVRCGRLHHNPCSARIDASSRKQFGMCDRPEASGKSVCDSCPHTRRMHSTAGCTWSDPKGNCRCPVTFMDL